MTQDEKKQAVARAALEFVEAGTVVGVGTGSTANYFIDALAEIKHKVDGTIASSEESARRLQAHGIRVMDFEQCQRDGRVRGWRPMKAPSICVSSRAAAVRSPGRKSSPQWLISSSAW